MVLLRTPTVHLASSPPPAGARRSRSKLQKSDSGKNTRVMIYHYYSDKGILFVICDYSIPRGNVFMYQTDEWVTLVELVLAR